MSGLLRIKCPSCGNVSDVPGNSMCPRCNNMMVLPPDAVIQIYRMGSPIGIAAGYGIYINGQPYGHIANKQSIRIPVHYGTYNLHFTCGLTRRCRDLTVILTPETRFVYVKARIKPGFWTNTIIAELSRPENMPPII